MVQIVTDSSVLYTKEEAETIIDESPELKNE